MLKKKLQYNQEKVLLLHPVFKVANEQEIQITILNNQ